MEKEIDSSINLDSVEMIPPSEYIRRLNIAKSTLHLWKSKGWLVERRHYLKIGKTVLYLWSNELLLELHDNCSRASTLEKEQANLLKRRTTLSNDRINWNY